MMWPCGLSSPAVVTVKVSSVSSAIRSLCSIANSV